MTDGETTYDAQGLGVRLTDERDLNAATRLEGYPLAVVPDEGWPGLAEVSEEVRADPEAMERVATWLEERAGAVSGLPKWLAEGASVSYGSGEWHEANHLADASGIVTGAVAAFVEKIRANMGQAAASIRAAGATYTENETANTATFDAIDTRVQPGSDSGPVVF